MVFNAFYVDIEVVVVDERSLKRTHQVGECDEEVEEGDVQRRSPEIETVKCAQLLKTTESGG